MCASASSRRSSVMEESSGISPSAYDVHVPLISACSTGAMKQPEPSLSRRIAQRDAALRRLRRTTAASLAGASALALAFGGLAARSFAGHGRTSSRGLATAAAARGGQAVNHVRAAPVATHPPALVPAAAPVPTP